MNRAAIYIETSVVSYLAARPSRDIIVAAHQQLTLDWWENQRHQDDHFISQIVLEEAQAGDRQAAEKRLAVLENMPLLEIDESVIRLAETLVQSHAIPIKAVQDALHIAVACINGMDYLLTWNCKHIANAKMRSKIEQVCREEGYVAPIICTPEELED
ncbi:MAG: type II toxin-antitoxin system VapC family toxin [Blastocatellia bacterium]